MNAARLDRSDRLRRVLDALADGGDHSTRDLIIEAEVCAVNSCVAELREQGHAIECCRDRDASGGPVWLYRLADPATARAALDRIAEEERARAAPDA